jgi:hypothetical protein
MKRTATIKAGMILGAMVATTAQANPVLDQELASGLVGTRVTNGQSRAQVFTVGVSGLLDSVVLPLSRWDASTGTVSGSIWSVTSAGLPDEQIVATVIGGPIQSAELEWIPFDFSVFALQASAGQQLAIVIDLNLTWAEWHGVYSDVYPGGGPTSRSTNPLGDRGVFGPANKDLGFRTYVNPIPEPSTAPSSASDLRACLLGGGCDAEVSLGGCGDSVRVGGIGHSSCLLAQRPSLGVMLNP